MGLEPSPFLVEVQSAFDCAFALYKTDMVPECVSTITMETNKAVDTYQEFTRYVLEKLAHRLRDSTLGGCSVCYSIIKNAPLATIHIFLRLINQSFTEGRLATTRKPNTSIQLTASGILESSGTIGASQS